jgi:hypothetical protein
MIKLLSLKILNNLFYILNINKIPELKYSFNKYDKILTEEEYTNEIRFYEKEITRLNKLVESLIEERNQIIYSDTQRANKILNLYTVKNNPTAMYEKDIKTYDKTEFVKEKCIIDKNIYSTVMFYKGKKIKIKWFFEDGLNKLYDILDYEQKIIDKVFDGFHEKIQRCSDLGKGTDC